MSETKQAFVRQIVLIMGTKLLPKNKNHIHNFPRKGIDIIFGVSSAKEEKLGTWGMREVWVKF